ncbi:elongation factor P 5-aminopentanone reductase [Domibacillus robiginosus]|uniref:elongation factor P 5-aminopentanone reductase n=1 Tax=Domibacillus robiginosus TaxID=1071054 RepID=UPI00067D807F|nr:SDR family oxidoreductase [Domibacillus robiginosus]
MEKTVLITGASGGIGRAIALKMAASGWHTILHYSQNEESVRETAEAVRKLGRDALIVRADLTNRSEIQHVIEASYAASAIIFAAGMSQYAMLQDVSDEEMERLWLVHVKAPMILSRELLPSLRQRAPASITLISSIWGEAGASCEAVYSAVKGAQIAFSKALAKELGPSHIRVNTIAPGAVDTPMNDQFSQEEKKEMASDIPLGRFALPDEIASAASFLASSEAGYITGHTLSVNGGWYA